MRRAPSSQTALALILAAFHFVLCVLIVIEDTSAPVDSNLIVGRLLSAGAVSLVLGATGAALWPSTIGRWLARALITLCNALVIIDHAVASAFGAPLDVASDLGALPSLNDLLDSAVQEMTQTIWLNLAVATSLSLALWMIGWNPRRDRVEPYRRTIAATAALSLVGAVYIPMDSQLAPHPLIAAWRSVASRDDGTAPPAALPTPGADAAAAIRDDPAVAEQLAKAASAIQALTRPNIVLITLESVAAPQLLDHGGPRPEVAPTLARLAQSAIVFDQVYTCTPETMRSQLQLNTGLAMTWRPTAGSAAAFAGPTLAKTMKAAGYRTAFMTGGDLDYTDTRDHLPPTGYDLIFDASSIPAELAKQRRLNSWGVEDSLVYQRAADWAAAQAPPFFLQILTLSTHHPYDLPRSSAVSHDVSGDGNHAKYLEALKQSDADLAAFLTDLRHRNLFHNTILVLTGDHGEAFGEMHRGVLIHGRSLFDEEIRTFLIIVPPGGTMAIHSDRVASVGDIAATITALAGTRFTGPGRNLLAPSFTPEVVFSHHRHGSPRCALRDGRWKFIGALHATGEAKLFDLEQDPDEQRDLIFEQQPEARSRVERYRPLCSAWYTGATSAYLAARQGSADPAVAAASVSGPRSMRFGSGTASHFRARERVPWNLPVAVELELVPYANDTYLRFDWHSPAGTKQSWRYQIPAGASRHHRNFFLAPPEAGLWQLTVREDDRAVMTGSITLEPPATPRRRD